MLNVGGKKVVGKWDITNRVAKFFYFAAAENSFFLWEATTQNIPPAAPSSFTLCRVSSLNQMTKRSFYFVDLWQLLIECCCPDFLLQSLNRISSISQFYTAGRPGGGGRRTLSEHLKMDLDNQWPLNWSIHLHMNVVGDEASSQTPPSNLHPHRQPFYLSAQGH